MASRELYSIFVILRNNHIHTRLFYLEDKNDDHTALLKGDIEMGNISLENQNVPKWMELVGEVRYGISKIKSKIKELNIVHQNEANKPSFEDNSPVEVDIKLRTSQIIKMLSHCQLLVKKLSLITVDSEAHFNDKLITPDISMYYQNKEYFIKQNLSNHLIYSLVQLTSEFRSCQSKYLNEIEKRKCMYNDILMDNHDTFNQNYNVNGTIPLHFDSAIMRESYVSNKESLLEEEYLTNKCIIPQANRKLFVNPPDESTLPNSIVNNHQPLNQMQTQCQEINLNCPESYKDQFSIDFDKEYYSKREHEIGNLEKSIQELNVIFCDLSHIVNDQGTMIDRIDYNIEKCFSSVQTGLTQVFKAVSIHRSATNKKLICTLAFALFVVFLSLALIISRL